MWPGRRMLEAGDFAAHAHPLKGAFDCAFERGREFAYGVFGGVAGGGFLVWFMARDHTQATQPIDSPQALSIGLVRRRRWRAVL